MTLVSNTHIVHKRAKIFEISGKNVKQTSDANTMTSGYESFERKAEKKSSDEEIPLSVIDPLNSGTVPIVSYNTMSTTDPRRSGKLSSSVHRKRSRSVDDGSETDYEETVNVIIAGTKYCVADQTGVKTRISSQLLTDSDVIQILPVPEYCSKYVDPSHEAQLRMLRIGSGGSPMFRRLSALLLIPSNRSSRTSVQTTLGADALRSMNIENSAIAAASAAREKDKKEKSLTARERKATKTLAIVLGL